MNGSKIKYGFLIICLILTCTIVGCEIKLAPSVSPKIESYEIVSYNGYPAVKVSLRVSEYPVTLAILDENKKILSFKVINNASENPAILYFNLIPLSKNLKPGTYYIQLKSGTPFGEIKEIKQVSEDELIIRWKASKELDIKKITVLGSRLEILDMYPETTQYFDECALTIIKLLVKNVGDYPVYFNLFTKAYIIIDKDIQAWYFIKGGPIAPGEEGWIDVIVSPIETFPNELQIHIFEIFLSDYYYNYVIGYASSYIKIANCKSYASITKNPVHESTKVEIKSVSVSPKYDPIYKSYDLLLTLTVKNYGTLPVNIGKVIINIKDKSVYLQSSDYLYSPLHFYLGPAETKKILGFANINLKSTDLSNVQLELKLQSKGGKILAKYVTSLSFVTPKIDITNVNIETTYWKFLNEGAIVKVSFLATNKGDLPVRIEKLIIFINNIYQKELLIYKYLESYSTKQITEYPYIKLSRGIYTITIKLLSQENNVVGVYTTKVNIL